MWALNEGFWTLKQPIDLLNFKRQGPFLRLIKRRRKTKLFNKEAQALFCDSRKNFVECFKSSREFLAVDNKSHIQRTLDFRKMCFLLIQTPLNCKATDFHEVKEISSVRLKERSTCCTLLRIRRSKQKLNKWCVLFLNNNHLLGIFSSWYRLFDSSLLFPVRKRSRPLTLTEYRCTLHLRLLTEVWL